MPFHVPLGEPVQGWIAVECPALPGCISQGRDETEALENICEAIAAWLWAADQRAMQSISPEQSKTLVAI
jgi:predicted RNase H-like HicB family nuclease